MNTYEVTIADTAGGPDAAMRQRLATCAAYRLASLDRRTGHYPEAGGEFDMLDNLSGPFFWERSQEQLANEPPSRVDYEVVSVDPPTRPEVAQTVRVAVRVLF